MRPSDPNENILLFAFSRQPPLQRMNLPFVRPLCNLDSIECPFPTLYSNVHPIVITFSPPPPLLPQSLFTLSLVRLQSDRNTTTASEK